MSILTDEQLALSAINLTDPSKLWCEIYMITNKATGAKYIGQALSHMKVHGQLIPHGHKRRLISHVERGNIQCTALKNAMNYYGAMNFEVQLLDVCSVTDGPEYEKKYIELHNTLVPFGYNIILNSRSMNSTESTRKNLSNATVNFYQKSKLDKFRDVKTVPTLFNIHPVFRKRVLFSWYIYFERKKAEFGGVQISVRESFKNAFNFLYDIKVRNSKNLEEKALDTTDDDIDLGMAIVLTVYDIKNRSKLGKTIEEIQKKFIVEMDKFLAKHLDAGNSLRALTTTLFK